MKDKRLATIEQMLDANGQVNVKELTQLLGVSDVTIRSDLITLEKQGVLFRTYGGAVRRAAPVFFAEGGAAADTERAIEGYEKKREIAQLAGRYVKENSWVYLSSGTTCNEVAKVFFSHSVNVVTGNMVAAQILGESSTVQVLVTGGNLVKGNNYFFLRGDWYLRAMEGISVDQAFLSVSGVDMDGYSWGNALECESQMMDTIRRAAAEIIVMVDSTKFGKRSFLSPEKLDFADVVISNADIPEAYKAYYRAHNIKLILPD